MKKIKFIAFVLLSIFIASCSNDESKDESEDEQQSISDPNISTGTFNLVYDNQTKKMSAWKAINTRDFIEVSGQTVDGIGIDFKFNTYGNLYQAFTFPVSSTSTLEGYDASEDFTSNTFTFTLVEFNPITKIIKVNFSGKFFKDAFDDTSISIPISGSFNITYSDSPGSDSGLGTFAKIDGKDWHGLSMSNEISYGLIHTKTLYVENDGEYSIGIVFPVDNMKTGTFPFTNNDFSNRISFQKYDVTKHADINYNVSGTITYTAMNGLYVFGTFSLTATHPVDKTKIVITNGTFRESL